MRREDSKEDKRNEEYGEGERRRRKLERKREGEKERWKEKERKKAGKMGEHEMKKGGMRKKEVKIESIKGNNRTRIR